MTSRALLLGLVALALLALVAGGAWRGWAAEAPEPTGGAPTVDGASAAALVATPPAATASPRTTVIETAVAPAVEESPASTHPSTPRPEFGSVEVCLRAGATRCEVWFGVQVALCPAPAPPGKATKGGAKEVAASVFPRGRALFGRIRCGRRYQVSVRGLDEEIVRTIDGPTGENDRVRIEVQVPPTLPILALRAVDTAGQPIERQQLGVRGDAIGQMSLALVDQRDGQVRLVLPKRFVGVQPTVEVRPGHHDTFRRRRGTAWLPGPLQPGTNDLGEVVVRDLPLLVRGQVVGLDPSTMGGDPLAHRARVQVEIQHQAPDAQDGWDWIDLLQLDADGRFEVWALPQPGQYRAVARGDIPSRDARFEPGTSDLVIQVEAPGTVHAEFLVDRCTPLDKLTYQLSAAGRRSIPGRAKTTGAGVTCRWSNLAAGVYRLTVTALGGGAPIIDIPGISVESGASTSDPRLRALDLRGKLRCLRLVVTDTNGAPVAGDLAIEVLVQGASGRPPGSCTGKRGAVELALAQPANLLVAADGYQPRLLDQVFEDRTIALTRAGRLTVHLPLDRPTLPDDVQLRATFMWVRPETDQPVVWAWVDGPTIERSEAFDAEGALEVSIPMPGPLRLGLRAQSKTRGRRRVDITTDHLPVDLELNGEDQAVRLQCPRDVLRTAIEAVKDAVILPMARPANGVRQR
ncbi:MAG: hypothetical protein AAF628_27015 [Planctomycetota bacterium]